MATSLSGMAGLTTPPVLTSSEALRSPVVLSAREICLPSGITQVLDPVEMRLLLAHEMAHIGRGDLRWLLLANVLCCLLWFAPVYLFAERRRRDAAELCCDDWAARRAGDAYGMARCLVRVAQWTAIRQGSVGLALTGSSSISHRVERLLDAESRKCRIWPVALVLALLPLAALTPRVAPGDGLGSPHGALVHRVVQERVVVLRAPQQ
jgi:beta-lactamase regulating signal transducer with metallopeptidase domain